MMQRYQNIAVEQQLIQTQIELENQIYELQNLSLSHLSSSESAQIITEIFAKTSFPTIGAKFIKSQLQMLKWPFLSQFQMIIDKAELIYVQSIMYDLNRLKKQQKVAYFSSEDIKQSIDQINWKLAIDKESILNQSQEIGQNMDIMKFFQGVRNYQNWQQQLQKQSVRRLISYANEVQNQLTLKKGYQITKIVKCLQKLTLSNLRTIFQLDRDRRNKYKGSIVISRVLQSKFHQHFNSIQLFSNTKKPSGLFKQLINRYLNQKGLSFILPWARYTKQKNIKLFVLCNAVSKIFEMEKRVVMKKFFNIFNNKPFRKAAYSYDLIEKVIKLSKKCAFTFLCQGFKLNKQLACKKIFDLLIIVQNDLFDQLFQKSKIIENAKPAVSNRLRGKILLSLQKHSSKPINIRKTFLNWYLKSHERKFSKQIYNIWLHGNINKFTFFMRLKNLVDETRQYKIKFELKLFLKLFCEKLTKYYHFHQKGYLQKWQQAVRRIKTIENNKKMGKKKLLNHIQKIQVKEEQKKQIIFEIFKSNLMKGKDKKIKVCLKAFRQDQLYRQKFLDKWRAQNKLNLIYQEEKNKNKWEKKKQSLRKISQLISNKQKMDSRTIIGQFSKYTCYKVKRDIKAKNCFMNFLIRNQRENKQKCLDFFVENWKQGTVKKNKIVASMVHANIIQQSRGFNLWKEHALSIQKADKLQKIRFFFEELDQITKKNNSAFFKDRFSSKALNKIISNKAQNMHIILKKFNDIPPRYNWDYRKSLIHFVQKVSLMADQNKNCVFQKFVRDHQEGKFKKKKCMDIMAFKYFDVSQKYFNRYRTNVKQAKAYERSKRISKFFGELQDISISSFKVLLGGQKEWVKKSKCIQKLNSWVQDKKMQAFKLWREGAKALTYFVKINNEKKSRCLQILTKSLKQSQNVQSQKIIRKFKKHAQIIQIQKNFMNRLLNSQIGKTYHVLSIWKNLPPLKDKQLVSRACKFQKKLQNFVQKRLKFSFTQFQQDLFKGNERKRIVARTLISQYSAEINGYFKRWRQNKNLTVIFQKCSRIRNLVQLSQQHAINSFCFLFKDGGQSKLIIRTFENMVKRWQKLQRVSLMNWFRFVNEQKYKDFIKRNSLKNMSYLIKKTEKTKMLQNINLFVKKAKLGTIVHSFIDKYHLKSRRQSLSHAIKSMKQLPDLKIYKKYQQKKTALNRCVDYSQRQINFNGRQIFQRFKHNRYRGEFKKQKAFSNYLNHKIDEVSEVLHKWSNLVKEEKRNNKNQVISYSFNMFQEIVRSNFQHIFGNRRQFEIKTKVMQRLFRTQQIKIKGFIDLWRAHTKELKILAQLKNKNKTMVLEKMARLLDNNSQQGAKKVIKNFHHHFKIVQVQRKFVNRLLQTKSGKVMQAFQVWKDIPNQNLMQNYKKGQKFYFKLQGILKKRMVQTHKNFKNQYDEGNNYKKMSILKMFDATSSGIRKLYARWSMLTKKSKTIQTVKQTIRFFDAVQQCNHNQWLLLFQDQRSYRIKAKAIEKLIANCCATTKTYFDIWRSRVQQYKIQQGLQNQQKKLAVAFFNKVIGKSENHQAVGVIQKFKMNFKIKRVASNFFDRLLMTKTGKMLKLIEKWKSIPDIKFAKKRKNAFIFESRLNKFYLKSLRGCLQPFKQQNYQATNKKRQCIERLLRLCQSDSRTKFDAWRNINRQAKTLKNSKNFENSFQICTNMYVQLFKLLTQDTKRQTYKKQNICRKMIKNSNFAVHHAYLIWKQAHQIDNLVIAKEQAKVKINLKGLIEVVKQGQNKEAIQVIHQFRNNFEVFRRIKEKMAIQISDSRYYSFYEKINGLVIKLTGYFFKTLKENTIQRNVVDRVRCVQACFQAMSQVYRSNWNVVIKSNRDSKIMERAIQKIFENYSYNARNIINIWRQKKNILRLHSHINNQKKKNLLSILTRVVNNNQQKLVPTIIQQFRTNYRVKKLQKQILHKILNTKAGKVPLVFMTWKNLPNPGAKKLKQTAMKFEAGLARFYRKQVKLSFESFRNQSYEAGIRKKTAVRKLILVTMSDSNRFFNKWRKITNQTKITSMIRNFDQSASIMNTKLNEFFGLIFSNYKQQLRIKEQAVKQIVKRNSEAMVSSIKIWHKSLLEQRIYLFEKIIDDFQPRKFNKKILRLGFQAIRRKCQIENLRGYINSLWKWKSSNMQANYYSKFIKVFRQSEELLNFSNLFNRKYNENLHYSFRMILSESQQRTEAKKRIIQKYFTKKLRHYFCAFKENALKKQAQIWREKFTKNIKVNLLSDVLSNILRRQQYKFFFELIRHDGYISSLERFDQILKNYERQQISYSFDRIHKKGYMDFFTVLTQTKERSQYNCLKQIFTFLCLVNRISKFQQITAKSSLRYSLRISFSQIRKTGETNYHKKLSLTLLNQLYKQKQKAEMFRILNFFKRKKQEQMKLSRLNEIFTRKENQVTSELFEIGRRVKETQMLLRRFSKGLKIKKIMDKQDKKLLSEYFERMRMKYNPWIQLSIRQFAAKASLQSSIAVSLWRIKNLTAIKN